MQITEDTTAEQLAALVGKRVRIARSGTPVQFGTFESLFHSTLVPASVGGMLLEDPHPGCKGGMTGFNVPYGSVISVVPTSRPPAHGKEYWHLNMRYRLWTAATGLRFDDMRVDDGPSVVPVDSGWHVSYTVPMGWTPALADVHDGKVELLVWRGDYRDPERHPLNGSRHDTMRDAHRAAYEAGLIAFMIYETQEYRYPALSGL